MMVYVILEVDPEPTGFGAAYRNVAIRVGRFDGQDSKRGEVLMRSEEVEALLHCAEPETGFIAATFDDGRPVTGVEFRAKIRG